MLDWESFDSNFGIVQQQHVLIISEQPMHQSPLISGSCRVRSDQSLGWHKPAHSYSPCSQQIQTSWQIQTSFEGLSKVPAFFFGPPKSEGINALPPPPLFVVFLTKWSISLLTVWHLPGIHQRQRQEADCWGWLPCPCSWLQGLNCDTRKRLKKPLSLKTPGEGGFCFCGVFDRIWTSTSPSLMDAP